MFLSIEQKQRVLPQAKRIRTMAIARLSVKVGKLGKAQPHAAYIARQGQYANRLDRGEKLEATGQGNMPAWAAHNPLAFWEAADRFERKNGSTYREHEIALPRELTPEQRLSLVNNWIKNEIGNKHAYQYAIHNPTAADGREQPHAHLMFSERLIDGIERDPDQYFKRYNSKYPERGGSKKMNTGLKHSERKELLKEQRSRWQDLCNRHLEQAGVNQSIDMRSYQEQGKAQQPEPKYLPSEWRKHQAEVIEFREAQKEQQQAKRDASQIIKDSAATLAQLKQQQQEKQQQRFEKKIEEGINRFSEKSGQWEQRQKAEKQKLQSDPKHIEKVFNTYLEKENRYRQEQIKAYDQAIKVAEAKHSDIFCNPPEKPQGLFARFKEKQYRKDLADWESKEREANSQRIQAKRQKDHFRQDNNPEWDAKQRFKKDHPEMARERERLEKERMEKVMEEARKEREQRERSRSRGRGGGLEL